MAALPVLLAGCSGSTSEGTDKLGKTRDRIIGAFKSEAPLRFTPSSSTSEELRKWAGLPRVERLNPKPSKLQAKRYGNFAIFVYEGREGRDYHARFLESPDPDGVYWGHNTIERGPEAGTSYWYAEKLYGENVVLTWWPSSRERELSDQWTRLDGLLEKSAG